MNPPTPLFMHQCHVNILAPRERITSMDNKAIFGSSNLYLTTIGRKTGSKHQVEIWFAYDAPHLYFLAHSNQSGSMTDWCNNLQRYDKCWVRIHKRCFECRAVAIGGKPLEEKARSLFKKKYQAAYHALYEGTHRLAVQIRVLG